MATEQVTVEIDAINRSQGAFRQAEQSLQAIETQSNQLRRETLQYRSTLHQLNEELARNNRALLTAEGAAREHLQTRNRQIRTEQQFLRVQQQSASLTLAGIQQQRRELSGLTESYRRSTSAGNLFQRSLSGIGATLGALGIAVVSAELVQFARSSVTAAAQVQQLQRGLEITTGSAAAAAARMDELIEVANRPGLQLNELVNFNNRLSAIGLSAEDIDKILLTTGQTIVSLGGNSHIAGEAVEQLTQAFQAGRVSLQDFRSIAQRIPGFYQAIADVHDVGANIDGLREAFDNAGGSLRDVLIPVMDELARRFEAPPSDSYVVAMDSLENAFLLTQAAIGDQFLPVVTDAAFALAEFLETVRAGITDVSTLPEPIQAIVEGASALWNALQRVGDTLAKIVGPPSRRTRRKYRRTPRRSFGTRRCPL